MIKCTTVGVEPSDMCYEICVMARRCGALKAWEREQNSKRKEQTMSEQPKPCPFCGDIVEIREEMDGRAETYSIHCRGCDMHYTKFVWRARDKRGVVKEWNQRANQ